MESITLSGNMDVINECLGRHGITPNNTETQDHAIIYLDSENKDAAWRGRLIKALTELLK